MLPEGFLNKKIIVTVNVIICKKENKILKNIVNIKLIWYI